MFRSIVACPERRRGERARLSLLLASVLIAAAVSAALTRGQFNAQTAPFAMECALKETSAITLIEDHGAAEDLPSDRLGEAGLTMLRARAACYDGRVGEALALYDSILKLGPVASLRRQ
jgi:hypothetical protein